MQSVMSNVELVARIVGWLDDIPSIVRSSAVSRSFRKATTQAAHTSLVISAFEKRNSLDPRPPRPPTLSHIVEWLQRKGKLLSELSSVHIRARESFNPSDIFKFGMIFQMLFESRPSQLKIASDLLFSQDYNMPDSIRNVTIFAGKWIVAQAHLDFSHISDCFPQLERLVLSHDVYLYIDDTSSPMKQMTYLQFSNIDAEEVAMDSLNCLFPALQEVKYCIHTDVDDDAIESVNQLLQVCTLRKADFSVHPLVTKPIVFQVAPDLEVSVNGASKIDFHRIGSHSPIRWY